MEIGDDEETVLEMAKDVANGLARITLSNLEMPFGHAQHHHNTVGQRAPFSTPRGGPPGTTLAKSHRIAVVIILITDGMSM